MKKLATLFLLISICFSCSQGQKSDKNEASKYPVIQAKGELIGEPQSLDYRYNIRGWLTSINNAQLSDAANNNDTGQAQDYWGMELGYNNALSGITATPAFNGNISAVKWSDNLGLGNATNIKERAYAYTYDPMNRIKSAQHSQYTSAWAANDHFKLEPYLRP